MFDNESVPADVVPPSGPSAETLLRLNEAAGQQISWRECGDLIEGVDDRPWGVGPAENKTGGLVGVAVSPTELERAGLTRHDVPNLRVIDLNTGADLNARA